MRASNDLQRLDRSHTPVSAIRSASMTNPGSTGAEHSLLSFRRVETAARVFHVPLGRCTRSFGGGDNRHLQFEQFLPSAENTLQRTNLVHNTTTSGFAALIAFRTSPIPTRKASVRTAGHLAEGSVQPWPGSMSAVPR